MIEYYKSKAIEKTLIGNHPIKVFDNLGANN